MKAIKKRIVGILFAGIACACVVACLLVCWHLGLWLVVSDPLPPSIDAYFTFASDNERIIYSKLLYNRYPQAVWVLSYPRQKILKRFWKQGLDTSRVIVVDTCLNTSSEAACIVNWANEALRDTSSEPARRLRTTGSFSPGRGIKIGLVSSPYHMRRIKILVEGKHPDKRTEFFFLPVPFRLCLVKRNDYENWWSNKYLAPVVWAETGKIAYALWCNLWE
jgi:uncharacterized SAM-binding protein YcdF (DUF218 family)